MAFLGLKLTWVMIIFAGQIRDAKTCPKYCQCSEKDGPMSRSVTCIPVSKFSRITAIIDEHLFFTKNLTIVNGNFQTLDYSNFTHASVNASLLHNLKLESCGITRITRGAFRSFMDLQYLAVEGNDIDILIKRTFNGLQSLKNLSLSNNRLAAIEATAFVGLDSLEVLSLSGNFLSNITNPVFAPLRNLKALDLSNNNFQVLSGNSDVFDGLTQLEILDISDNALTDIQNGAFDRVKKLKNLTLRKNQLSELHSYYFESLVHLRVLNLGVNRITYVHTNAFENLKQLEKLDLSYNRIEEICNSTEHCFSSLGELTELVLKRNEIRCLSQHVFSGLHKVSTLDLSNNDIEGIAGALTTMSQLEDINLAHNSLKDFSQKLIDGLKKLKVIHLQKNRVCSFDYKRLHKLQTDMKIEVNYDKQSQRCSSSARTNKPMSRCSPEQSGKNIEIPTYEKEMRILSGTLMLVGLLPMLVVVVLFGLSLCVICIQRQRIRRTKYNINKMFGQLKRKKAANDSDDNDEKQVYVDCGGTHSANTAQPRHNGSPLPQDKFPISTL